MLNSFFQTHLKRDYGCRRFETLRFHLNSTFVTLVAAALLAWEFSAHRGWLDPLFFPAPSYLFVAAGKMILEGEFLGQVWLTLYRTLVGFTLGSVAGLICGLLMGGFSGVRRALEPLVSAIYTTPKVSLLPILMLFFGIGETPKLILASVGCFIIVALQVLDAVRRVKPGYVEMASNYGASRLEIFRRVYLPASMPHLFTGLRLALGWALMITVAVEMVSSGDGLGGMLWLAWQTFTTEKIFIGVFTASLLGLVFHAGLRHCESKLIPWSSDAETT